MTGDFKIVRQWLDGAHVQYPNLISEETVVTIEQSFIRIRELVLTTRTYALLIIIELGRIRRVQQRLMGLGYLDVLGRARLTIHLVRVTLAVPMVGLPCIWTSDAVYCATSRQTFIYLLTTPRLSVQFQIKNANSSRRESTAR